MGNFLSSSNIVTQVKVKVKPYFYILDEDGYSQDKIKKYKIYKNITLKKKDKDYIFGVKSYKINKTDHTSTTLLFEITYKEGAEVSELESYIKDAWFNYCGSGAPIKPNFIKEKKHATKPIYFGIDSVDFIYK